MKEIELVIKIPVETYEYWKEHSHEYVLAEAIKNGIPLPKGHDRLVEAHAVVKALFDYKTIDDVPTIIEADKEKNNEHT